MTGAFVPVPDRIVLDLSRLVYAAWSPNPTGIPRVEHAYAEFLLARSPALLEFAVRDAFGRLCLAERDHAVKFTHAIGAFWRDEVASRPAHRWLMLRALRLHAGLILRGARSLHRHVATAGGRIIYIIASQLHLETPEVIERLRRAGDVRLLYFVHDVIPARFPEFFLPGDADRNRARMRNAARFADAIIVNSEATRCDFLEHFGQDRVRGGVYVAPLGAVPSFLRPLPAVARVPPYFLCIGTIEPRKNHLLLLNLWRRFGADSPHLIIVGGRGWENENVIDVLERSVALRDVVEERNFVSDSELRGLLSGARALLLPSLAEGYGLPLVEALTSGVPVLCSDLPAFREVGGDVPEYLDPLDGPAWERAIREYAAEPSARRTAQIERLKEWRAPTWEAHFAVLETALRELGTDAAAPRVGRRLGGR